MEKHTHEGVSSDRAVAKEGRNPIKIPIEKRARTAAEEARFAELALRAKALEKKLDDAFGSAPKELEILAATEIVQEELIAIAAAAREFGRHYEGFTVGGAMLGFKSPAKMTENPWKVL